eukprot:scaffold106182_cov36-Phaeocystis_antarctica.AAC.2
MHPGRRRHLGCLLRRELPTTRPRGARANALPCRVPRRFAELAFLPPITPLEAMPRYTRVGGGLAAAAAAAVVIRCVGASATTAARQVVAAHRAARQAPAAPHRGRA